MINNQNQNDSLFAALHEKLDVLLPVSEYKVFADDVLSTVADIQDKHSRAGAMWRSALPINDGLVQADRIDCFPEENPRERTKVLALQMLYEGSQVPYCFALDGGNIRFVISDHGWNPVVAITADGIRIELSEDRWIEDVIRRHDPEMACMYGVMIALAKLYQKGIRHQLLEPMRAIMPTFRKYNSAKESMWLRGICCALADMLREANQTPADAEHPCLSNSRMGLLHANFIASAIQNRIEAPAPERAPEWYADLACFMDAYCAGREIFTKSTPDLVACVLEKQAEMTREFHEWLGQVSQKLPVKPGCVRGDWLKALAGDLAYV